MADPVPVVLIVEDDSPIADTLAVIIEDMGYTPVVAYNGRDGLAAALQQMLHLIITDMMMPQMSGADMIAALRTSGQHVPPIIVLTAADRVHAQEIGASAALRKPFDLNKFQSLVRELIEAKSDD